MTSPTLDTHASSGVTKTASNISTTSLPALSTNQSPDTILVFVMYEMTAGQGSQTVSSVTSANLTFTKRGSVLNTTSGAFRQTIELWSAPASGTLSAEVISVNWSGTVDDVAVAAKAFTGLHSTAAPFDTNAGLPDKAFNATTTTNPPVTFSTTQANDLLVYVAANAAPNQPEQPSPPTGWTNLFSIGAMWNGGGTNWQYAAVFYKSVSATQAGASVNSLNTGSHVSWAGLVDALTADASSSTETGTAVLAFPGISIVGKGSDATGAGRLAFSGISISGAASASHAGSGLLAFRGVSFSGAGYAEVIGDAGLSFAGISIVGSGIGLAPPGSGLRQFWTF